ncbi:flagellar filament capping protein FliD [Cupriavidus basilensis]|uniref:Flagellar hook-associated protein 2 n=1 Tax=Cupriavidus basilensis TaxID=68895 RepID=A0ABT6AV81_9BURK|nr:flagellar filament capping protein FliD [Cupriavidus basilensis]MDF3836537.1 flagellar filament capping protein FliD [Cupriavidus basilensis]
MAISSIGVGSNLDLATLLDNLQKAEEKKLTDLTAKQTTHTNKLSAYGLLQASLATFQNAASALGMASLYNSTTTTSSNTGTLTVSADKTAVAGSYAIDVTQLAQSQTLVSKGVVDGTGMALGNAKITIEFGTTDGTTFTPGTAKAASININGTNNTLSGIRDAINASNSGVTASIVNDGGSTPYRLVLTSNTTGAASSMRVSVDSNGSGDPSTISGLLAYDPAGTKAMKENIAAADAKLTINGIAVTSPTNTVQGAAQGLTLNLVSKNTSTVTVTTDTGAMATAVQNFVTAYNGLQTTAAKLTSVDQTSKSGSILTGDGTLRAIQNQLRSIFNTPQTASNDKSLVNLTQVGIKFNKDGTMALDTSKLNKALTENRTGVAQLFSGVDGKSGYGNQLSNMAKSFSDTKGLLTTATEGVNSNIKNLKTTYTKTSASIDATMARYRAQFQQLDSIMTKMNATKTYLTQQFNAMNNSSNK